MVDSLNNVVKIENEGFAASIRKVLENKDLIKKYLNGGVELEELERKGIKFINPL